MLLKLRLLLSTSLLVLFSFITVYTQAQTVETVDAYTKEKLPLPTVKSDKDDYAPGETAIIRGTGWTLDQSVDVHLEEDPYHIHVHDYHDTKVNADGSWEIKYPIEERHLGVKFKVIVEGQTSAFKAYAYFTDAQNTVTTLTSSINPSILGSSVTFTSGVTRGGGGQNNTVVGTLRIYVDDPAVPPAVPTTSPVATFSITANSNTGKTYSTSSLSVGSHKLRAIFTGDGNAPGYNNSEVSITQTVNDKTNPVVTWNDPESISYGNVLSNVQLNATANVPGSFEYTPALGTLLSAGNGQELTVTFTPNDLDNYNIVTKTVSLTVNKGTQTITWTAPDAITYGTLLGAAQLNASVAGSSTTGATAPGALTYTPGAGTLLGAGAHTLSVTAAETANYNEATKTVSLTVNKALPVIVWPSAGTIPFGTDLTGKLNAQAKHLGSNVLGTYVYKQNGNVITSSIVFDYATTPYTLDVEFTPADNSNYLPATGTNSISVTKAVPVITVVNAPDPVDYSDKTTFTIGITSSTAQSEINETGGEVKVYHTSVAAGNLLSTITQTAIVNGQVASEVKIVLPKGVYNLYAVFTPNSTNIAGATNTSGSFNVDYEDADVVFSGPEYFATENSTSTTAKVEFMATLTDKNDAATTRGIITNATADFVPDDITVTGPFANKTVNLINSSDPTVGEARTGIFNVGLSNSDMNYGGKTFSVMVKAKGNHYTGETLEATLITIAVPGQDFVNGGGHLVVSQASGSYAPTANSKVNFGFTMKWNKSGKNIQGQTNIIFRRLVGTIWRTYQVKSNAINTLGTANVTGGKKADFNTKANFTDITNPLLPVTITGNLDLTVQAFESEVAGVKDQIAITLRSSTGELMFSTNWVGGKTDLKDLNGGAIKVRSSFTAAPATQQIVTEARAAEVIEPITKAFNLKAFPNPSISSFNVQVESDNAKDKINVRVIDLFGRTVEVINGVAPGQTIKIGAVYRPGIYFVEMIQGNNRKQIKLLKQSD
jgi:hypothetical protein